VFGGASIFFSFFTNSPTHSNVERVAKVAGDDDAAHKQAQGAEQGLVLVGGRGWVCEREKRERVGGGQPSDK
jgi:hypothetical protein